MYLYAFSHFLSAAGRLVQQRTGKHLMCSEFDLAYKYIPKGLYPQNLLLSTQQMLK